MQFTFICTSTDISKGTDNSGVRLNIKLPSYLYKNSHYKGKTIWRPSHPYNLCYWSDWLYAATLDLGWTGYHEWKIKTNPWRIQLSDLFIWQTWHICWQKELSINRSNLWRTKLTNVNIKIWLPFNHFCTRRLDTLSRCRQGPLYLA